MNNSRNKIKAPKTLKGETVKTVFRTLFLCILVTVSASVMFFGWQVYGMIARAPKLDTNLIRADVSTLIFDQDENVVVDLGIERREWVQFNDISPVMIDALLAIEDARFFDHYGVDWSRTIAAVIYTARNLVTGVDSLQGGSTLTQQLINLTHLLDEETDQRVVTIERKLQEISLAIQLEREFSKEQIIEAYLNIAPFGGRIFGVQAAAEFYFGVNASELTLSQAATLAGIVQLPNVHRPDENANQTQNRRNIVLEMMVRHGFITPEIYDLAAAEPITDLLVYSEITSDEIERYEPFINRVLTEAQERFNINPFGGYQIFTTLDRDAQGFVYNLLMSNDYFLWPNNEIQTGVAMIGNDGRIRALAGREKQRTDNIERGFNLAADGRRQPGSVSKPIWAYGPAFEYLNWGTGTMINDELFAYASGQIVRNFDHAFRGRVSVRNSMDQSWNVPAVKAMNAVVQRYGSETVVNFVSNLGIPPHEEGLLESHAIGTHQVSPLQVAGAYSAFANGGTFNQPFTIERIIAPDGTILYESPLSERVMSEETAYMMSSILRTAMTDGTGQAALVPGQWVAGKTGTTNFTDYVRSQFSIPFGAVPDVWFAGYSMNYTVAIWTGYQYTNNGDFVHLSEQRIPRELFRIIMGRLNDAGMNTPVRPSTIVSREVEWQSGTHDGEVCLSSSVTPGMFRRTELFPAHAVPTCTSNRFAVPDVPENFEVASGDGTTLNFTWDHINNLPMTLEEAQAALSTAISLTQGQIFISDALRNLSPGEAEARMIIDQINAIGETEYVVIGTLVDGTNQELVSTRLNEASYSLSISDLAAIQSFHVIARFTGNNSVSGPSNVIANIDFIDPSEFEIPIPTMEDWTMNQFLEWAESRDVEHYEFEWEYSDTVDVDLIITTNPTNVITIDQTLRVIVSLGPQELPELPEIPGLPTLPNPEQDSESNSDTSDQDDPSGSEPFNISPDLEGLIHIGNFSDDENRRVSRMFTAVLERFRGIIH